MRSPRAIVCTFAALVGVLTLPAIGACAELEVVWDGTALSPEDIRAREAEKRAHEEAARREQQQIDSELARRGWPKSREGEVRKFLELQKKAAGLVPKPGAGAALRSESDAQDEWAKKREEAMTADARNSTGPKSNCWEEKAPPKVAMGVSTSSEDDARGIAMVNTRGCEIVAEMRCTSHANLKQKGNGLAIENGNFVRDGRTWDCRASYQCGETQKRCESKPAAGSAQ
jgi:hypothetical protein